MGYEVPLFITLWKGDDEFGPETNVLFDRSIIDIFPTANITVLSETLVHTA